MIVSLENAAGERGFVSYEPTGGKDLVSEVEALVNAVWAGDWNVVAWGDHAADETFEMLDLGNGS